MFVVSTRNFPPDVGGIQNLMEGLCCSLLEHGPVKVFADKVENSEEYDSNSKLNIQQQANLEGMYNRIFRKHTIRNISNL